jgi:protein SCO1/2
MPRTARTIVLHLVSCVLLTAGITSCTGEASRETSTRTALDTLPVLRTVTSFDGTDQKGATLSSSSLKGRVWLASFFFTTCESICPALNMVQAKLQKDFGDRVRFVSISTDPDTDTPPVMDAYAQRFGAKDGVWSFIVMPHERMLDVAANGLGLIAPTEPDVHSTRFVLVDTAMQVRGYYDSADSADVARLRSILAEVR